MICLSLSVPVPTSSFLSKRDGIVYNLNDTPTFALVLHANMLPALLMPPMKACPAYQPIRQ